MALYYGAPDLAASAHLRYGSPPPPPVQLPPIDYLRVPQDVILQPTWVNQYRLGDFRQDCISALQFFPPQGDIKSMPHPLIVTRSRCTIGLYFTKPKPNGNPVVEDQWANIHTWTSATFDLYLAFSTTGLRIDFASGLQVTIFEPWVVNLDPKRVGRTKWVMESLEYIINDSLSGNRGRGRARGQNRGRVSSSGLLPSATINPAISALHSQGTPTTSALFAGFTDANQLMPAWAGQPPMSREDCRTVIFEIAMITWFFSHAGLFFEKPYVFSYGRCALGLYLTTPATSGPAPFLPPDRTNLEAMLFALLIHTVIDHNVPGYADLPNGMQIAYWDWQYLDPLKQCWNTKKLSLQRCLNIVAMRKARALSSGSAAATTMPTLPSVTASVSSSTMPGLPTITSAASLPHATGSQTGAQTLLSVEGLAQSLAGLGIN
ncbi:hypothetical protein MMC32_001786 [Xylographa parallela]|nr:hypothetical protein [Xylographa parallela]